MAPEFFPHVIRRQGEKMKGSFRRNGTVVAAMAALLVAGAASCRQEPRQPGPEAKPAAAAEEVAPSPPKAGDAVVVIAGKPHDEKSVESFILTYGMGPHGMKREFKLVEDYIDRELVLHDVYDRGIARAPEHARQVRIFALSALGVDYARNRFGEDIPVDAVEATASLPKKTMIGQFDLLAFASEQEAKEALKGIKTEREFYHYAREHQDRLKSTGEVYPGSGFFHAFDESVLFGMKAGDLAGVLETGIGPAIVAVREVRDMTGDEIGRIVEKERRAARDRKKPELMRKIEEKRRIVRNKEKVYALAAKELGRGMGKEHDAVVAEVDDLKVSYRNLRAWIARDYIGSILDVTPEELGRLMYNDAINLVTQIVLGLEAEKEGYRIKDENNRKAIEELTKRYFYQVGVSDYAGSGLAVSDAEARKYYEDNKGGRFYSPERVRAGHVFGKSRKPLDEALKRLNGGEAFEAVARALSEDEATRDKGGEIGLVLDTPEVHKAVRDALFAAGKLSGGVTGIVHSGAGYHIFKVYERFPDKVTYFKEAKPGIVRTLRFEKFQAARQAYTDGLEKKYAVARNESKIKAIQDRIEALLKKAAPPVGPHGGGAPPGHAPRGGPKAR